jgi:hypothetical protein
MDLALVLAPPPHHPDNPQTLRSMKLNQYSRTCTGGFIVIIIAIIVVIMAGLFIWYIARILSQIKLGGSNTNNTEYYYNTNYSGGTTLSYQSATNNTEYYYNTNYSGGTTLSYQSAGETPSFTLFYCVPSFSNCLPWVAVTNCIVTLNGCGVDLINNSNEYMVSVNLGTYSVVEDYNAQTGAQLGSWTNASKVVVIQKSVDLKNWVPIFTDTNCLPDSILSYTDPNAVETKAFYRVVMSQ